MVPFGDCSSRAVSRELNCECNIADTDVLTIDIFLSFAFTSPQWAEISRPADEEKGECTQGQTLTCIISCMTRTETRHLRCRFEICFVYKIVRKVIEMHIAEDSSSTTTRDDPNSNPSTPPVASVS
jgi:hypothetical protein